MDTILQLTSLLAINLSWKLGHVDMWSRLLNTLIHERNRLVIQSFTIWCRDQIEKISYVITESSSDCVLNQLFRIQNHQRKNENPKNKANTTAEADCAKLLLTGFAALILHISTSTVWCMLIRNFELTIRTKCNPVLKGNCITRVKAWGMLIAVNCFSTKEVNKQSKSRQNKK